MKNNMKPEYIIEAPEQSNKEIKKKGKALKKIVDHANKMENQDQAMTDLAEETTYYNLKSQPYEIYTTEEGLEFMEKVNKQANKEETPNTWTFVKPPSNKTKNIGLFTVPQKIIQKWRDKLSKKK